MHSSSSSLLPSPAPKRNMEPDAHRLPMKVARLGALHSAPSSARPASAVGGGHNENTASAASSSVAAPAHAPAQGPLPSPIKAPPRPMVSLSSKRRIRPTPVASDAAPTSGFASASAAAALESQEVPTMDQLMHSFRAQQGAAHMHTLAPPPLLASAAPSPARSPLRPLSSFHGGNGASHSSSSLLLAPSPLLPALPASSAGSPGLAHTLAGLAQQHSAPQSSKKLAFAPLPAAPLPPASSLLPPAPVQSFGSLGPLPPQYIKVITSEARLQEQRRQREAASVAGNAFASSYSSSSSSAAARARTQNRPSAAAAAVTNLASQVAPSSSTWSSFTFDAHAFAATSSTSTGAVSQFAGVVAPSVASSGATNTFTDTCSSASLASNQDDALREQLDRMARETMASVGAPFEFEAIPAAPLSTISAPSSSSIQLAPFVHDTLPELPASSSSSSSFPLSVFDSTLRPGVPSSLRSTLHVGSLSSSTDALQSSYLAASLTQSTAAAASTPSRTAAATCAGGSGSSDSGDSVSVVARIPRRRVKNTRTSPGEIVATASAVVNATSSGRPLTYDVDAAIADAAFHYPSISSKVRELTPEEKVRAEAATKLALSMYEPAVAAAASSASSSSPPAIISLPALSPGQHAQLRSQIQLHLQLLAQSLWLCAVVPTPPLHRLSQRVGTGTRVEHSVLHAQCHAMMEEMNHAAEGTSTDTDDAGATPLSPGASASASAAGPASPSASSEGGGDADNTEAEATLAHALMAFSSTQPVRKRGRGKALPLGAPPLPRSANKVVSEEESSTFPPEPTPYSIPRRLRVPGGTVLTSLRVPALVLWRGDEELRNLRPVPAQERLETATTAAQGEESSGAQAMEIDGASTPKGSASAASAASTTAFTSPLSTLSSLSSSSSSATPSTASPPIASYIRDARSSRCLLVLPSASVMAFWAPRLATRAYGLDKKFLCRILQHERHLFSVAEEHLWRLGLTVTQWDKLVAEARAEESSSSSGSAAVNLSPEAELSLLTHIRRRFLPAKSLLHLRQRLGKEGTAARLLTPAQLALRAGGTGGVAALAASLGGPRGRMAPRAIVLPPPVPGKVTHAAGAEEIIEAGAEALPAREVRTLVQQQSSPGTSDAAAGASAPSSTIISSSPALQPPSSEQAPVLLLREFYPWELRLATEGHNLHGSSSANKWSRIAAEFLPHWPRKLLAKAWTKHEAQQAREARRKQSAGNASTAAAVKGGSESSAEKRGRKRKGDATSSPDQSPTAASGLSLGSTSPTSAELPHLLPLVTPDSSVAKRSRVSTSGVSGGSALLTAPVSAATATTSASAVAAGFAPLPALNFDCVDIDVTAEEDEEDGAAVAGPALMPLEESAHAERLRVQSAAKHAESFKAAAASSAQFSSPQATVASPGTLPAMAASFVTPARVAGSTSFGQSAA